MEKPKHIILCGLPYAGKTTVGRAIATITRFPHFPIDDVIRDFGLTQEESDMHWREIVDEHGQRLLTGLRQRGGVIDDRVHLTPSEREEKRRFSRQNNAEPVLVYVVASEETILSRWEENKNNPTRNHLSEQRLRMFLDTFEPPNNGEEHIIFRSGVDDVPRWIREQGVLLD